MSKGETKRDQQKISPDLRQIRDGLGDKLIRAMDDWAKGDQEKFSRIWAALRLFLNTAGDHRERNTAIPAFVRDILRAFQAGIPVDILRMAFSDALHFREQIITSIQEGRGGMYYNVPTPEAITFNDVKAAITGQLTPEQLHALFDGLE